jgi:N-carbamoyl-L-amino-acid hydrolase
MPLQPHSNTTPMRSRPEINGDRLLRRLAAFAKIGGTPAGGVNRQALSVEDRAARRLLAELALKRGFSVHQDGMANLFIRREGAGPARPPLLIGSHLDSQPNGGRFDGALGTLSAFEVLESLEDAGIETALPIEVVAWTNEEGSRFTPGVMGSMAFVHAADLADWSDLHGQDGASLRDELRATIAALPEALMRPLGMPVSGYIELHIEQGPALEREGISIGVVEAVQGTSWLDVTVCGQAGHAGTTPLEYRRDPMAAAAVAISDLHASIMPADADARMTIGRIEARPGSINAIPHEIRFTVDLRHPDPIRLESLEREVGDRCRAAAGRYGCTVATMRTFNMPPGKFHPAMIACIERAAAELNVSSRLMISGAFHDALFLSRVTPSAMIFVPCRDGISHNEAEDVKDSDVTTGARVLLSASLLAMQLVAR